MNQSDPYVLPLNTGAASKRLLIGQILLIDKREGVV